MNIIYVLRGLPASGKSTWARNKLKHHGSPIVRWNNDEFREMVYGKRWGGGPEYFVVENRDNFIRAALYEEFDVIVDNTNLNPVHLKTMQEKFGDRAEFQLIDFLEAPDICILRDSKREHSVGAGVIKKMAEKWDWPRASFKEDDWEFAPSGPFG